MHGGSPDNELSEGALDMESQIGRLRCDQRADISETGEEIADTCSAIERGKGELREIERLREANQLIGRSDGAPENKVSAR